MNLILAKKNPTSLGLKRSFEKVPPSLGLKRSFEKVGKMKKNPIYRKIRNFFPTVNIPIHQILEQKL